MKQQKKKIKKCFENIPYNYYWPEPNNCFAAALELEHRRRLNCWDREPDWGPEATKQRIMNDMKALKEGKIPFPRKFNKH